MAFVTLTHGGPDPIPASIQNIHLREKWRGVVDDAPQSVELSPGIYVATLFFSSGPVQQTLSLSEGEHPSLHFAPRPKLRTFATIPLPRSESRTIEDVIDHVRGSTPGSRTGKRPAKLRQYVKYAALNKSGSRLVTQAGAGPADVWDIRGGGAPTKVGSIDWETVLPQADTTSQPFEIVRVDLDESLSEPADQIRVSLWKRCGKRGWRLDQTPGKSAIRHNIRCHRFLRLSGRGRTPILVALPRRVAEIEIHTTPTGFAVDVRDKDARAQLLLELLQQREHRAASALAEWRLKQKGADPLGAAQAALALVRLFPELPQNNRPPLKWFRTMAKRFPWIPDGPIALAWYGLYLGKLDPQQVKVALLQAVERGIPANTDGLRLLKDGLELFAFSKEADPAAAAALNTVESWMAAADLTVPRTTLYGTGTGLLHGKPASRATNARGVSLAALDPVRIEGGWRLDL